MDVAIAGDGPERTGLERLAERLAPGRIRFLGRLTKAALVGLLGAAAAVVVPSRWWENQPMSVLEAMAAGAPVVAAAVGGIPELIDDGVDGRLVPPNDVAALAAALTRIGTDPVYADRIGRAGAERVRRANAPAEHVEALAGIYRDAAGAFPPGRPVSHGTFIPSVTPRRQPSGRPERGGAR
jgi:glycosyltransferase involved in cell wall biosynthesis